MEEEIKNIEHLIEQGKYLQARAMVQDATGLDSNIRLQQLYALATSKSGMPGLAQEFLEKTFTQHPNDAETAGILAGIYKLLFKQTENSDFAIKSRDTYLANFTSTGSYYTGINAATMSVIAGQARKGREVAQLVIEKLGDTADFWEVATLGEAHLLTKSHDKAVDFYLKARTLAGTDWGKVSSVYEQLWLLKHYMNVPAEILKVFHPPTVMAFVGHMVDHPDRAEPRFPASIQDAMKEGIRSAIKSQKGAIGYCSLACGGDILFAEAMEEEGGELNIFIPFAKDDFIRESVGFAGQEWVNRFERLIANRNVRYITHETYEDHTDLFTMQSKVVLGSTLYRSTMMRSDSYLITVMSDFDLSRLEGGTRDNISLWPFPDKVINVSPDRLAGNTGRNSTVQGAAQEVIMETDRPALYTLVISLSTDNQEAVTKLFDITTAVCGEVIVAPLVSCIAGDKMVTGFTGLRPLYDFVQQIRKAPKINQAQLQLTINGGPIRVSDFHEKDTVQYKVMEGPHFDKAIFGHQYGVPGSCIALSPIAYELALYKIDIELVSRASMEDGEMVDVYKLTEK